MISLIASRYTVTSVFYVLCVTLAAMGGMTYYAVTTKQDITIFNSMAFGMSACMLMVAIILIFTASPFLNMVYAFFGVGAALLYIVIDTQLIMNNRKYGISYDDYIKAALMLYLDFI